MSVKSRSLTARIKCGMTKEVNVHNVIPVKTQVGQISQANEMSEETRHFFITTFIAPIYHIHKIRVR
jgi:hypothetical protein